MQVLLLVALGIALVAVLFAVQNTGPVAVAFLGWAFEGSLALVLFVALIAGAVVSLAASAPSMVRNRRAIRRLRRHAAEVERQLDEARQRLILLGDPPPDHAAASRGAPPQAGIV